MSIFSTPVNEMGAVVTFAQECYARGIHIVHAQVSYPDMFIILEGKPVRVEIEYDAINFKEHRHDPRDCDLIVAWIDSGLETCLPVITMSNSDWSFPSIEEFPSELDKQFEVEEAANKAKRKKKVRTDKFLANNGGLLPNDWQDKTNSLIDAGATIERVIRVLGGKNPLPGVKSELLAYFNQRKWEIICDKFQEIGLDPRDYGSEEQRAILHNIEYPGTGTANGCEICNVPMGVYEKSRKIVNQKKGIIDIEEVNADPIGRKDESPHDDLYAFIDGDDYIWDDTLNEFRNQAARFVHSKRNSGLTIRELIKASANGRTKPFSRTVITETMRRLRERGMYPPATQ